MDIQETVINEIYNKFNINPDSKNQQISLEKLQEIIKYTTNTMLMAHFQILLDNYLQNIKVNDTNNTVDDLSILTGLIWENKADDIKSLGDFREIGKKIVPIEVRFIETTLGLKT